jgi:redox-sensitive bicupin YhaK (pirin superfamily)
MATATSTLTSESPKMTDLRHQLREASTPAAQRQVMVNTIIAGRANEISVTERKELTMEFTKISLETQVRLKAARRAAD